MRAQASRGPARPLKTFQRHPDAIFTHDTPGPTPTARIPEQGVQDVQCLDALTLGLMGHGD